MRIRMTHLTTQMEVYFCGLVARCANSVVLISRFIVWEALVNSCLQLEKTQIKRCNSPGILKLGRLGVSCCFIFQSCCLLFCKARLLGDKSQLTKKNILGQIVSHSHWHSFVFLKKQLLNYWSNICSLHTPKQKYEDENKDLQANYSATTLRMRGCILLRLGLLAHMHTPA